MKASDRPYSRVYWEARSDEKFATIWYDDRALATWMRLLVAADMAWPADGEFYAGVHRASVQKLVEVGLVDPVDAHLYRIHGLDREREGRRNQARDAAQVRWQNTSDAAAMRQHENSTAEAMPRQDKHRQAKTSRAEQAPDPAVADDDHLEAWYRLTASWPTAKSLPWLNTLAGQYGGKAVSSALALEWQEDSDRSTLLSRTQARLGLAQHVAEKEAAKRRKEAEAAERKRIEEMPLEQRRANLTRLRDMMVENGLAGPKP